MQFVEANNFINANRGADDIERIVMHTAETPETGTTAEAVANFFAAATTSVSAHYVVDNNSVVQCVKEADIAFHALGDNDQTIGIELAGKASQSREQWADDFSRAQLDLASTLVADICRRRNIPPKRLTNAELEARKRGIVSHKQVSDIFGQGIRSDPGPNFPWQRFLEDVENKLTPKIQYVLLSGEGQEMAHSAAVRADSGKLRRERLDEFLGNRLDMLDRELEQDRDAVLRRRKV